MKLEIDEASSIKSNPKGNKMTQLEIQNALRILTKAVKDGSKLEFINGDIIVLTVDDKETIART